jgi:hypothetical protein
VLVVLAVQKQLIPILLHQVQIPYLVVLLLMVVVEAQMAMV